MEQKTEKYKGYFAVFIANVIFGLHIPVSKALLSGWMTPMGFTLVRMLFGTLLFWTVGLFSKKEKVQPKDLLMIILGGFFGFVVAQFTLALALTYTTPVNFSLIVAMGPVVVMFLSALFLKEKITQNKVSGILLSITGAVLLIYHAGGNSSGTNDLLGIGIALINIISYAVYLILTRDVSQKYTSVTLMKWMFLFTLIYLLPFGAGDIFTQRIFSSETNLSAIFLLAFVFLFSTATGYFLMAIALKGLKTTTVSVYMNIQPIVASVVAIAVGQDAFSWDKPVAAILVLGGVLLVTKQKKQNN